MHRTPLAEMEALHDRVMEIAGKIETLDYDAAHPIVGDIYGVLCDQLWAIRDKMLWAY